MKSTKLFVGDAEPEESVLLPGEWTDPSRRAFLKVAGFGLASSALTGCSRAPAILALAKAEASTVLTPGVPYWIASACGGCSASCGILARCRDGRPIKLEGNPDQVSTGGGLCPTGQAEVLSLYDAKRIDGPREDGESRTWEQADAAMRELLGAQEGELGNIRLLTSTITSPSARLQIERFAEVFGAKHIEYDALSQSAALDAHGFTHGTRALPHLQLDRAEVIASFGADFLGTGYAPVEHSVGWAENRRPDSGRMSRHWQFESILTVTGGMADERHRIAPAEVLPALASLVELLSAHAAGRDPTVEVLELVECRVAIEQLARELWEQRGKCVVLCGGNHLKVQLLANQANELLGAYGSVLDLSRPSLQKRGDDLAVAELVEELKSGQVDLLLTAGCNPAYDRPDLAAVLAGAATVVSFASAVDETSRLARWVLPEPHFLESWGEAEPVRGEWTLAQPTVATLFNGRSLRESLAKWAGDQRSDLELCDAYLKEVVFPQAGAGVTFKEFLVSARQRGTVVAPRVEQAQPAFNSDAVRATPVLKQDSGVKLVLYPKVGMLAGAHAHNPWLQELPDPVSHIVWDNYAALSRSHAEELVVEEGDLVRISCAEVEETLELPVHIQAGQHDRVVAVALGYGRLGTDRFANLAPDWIEANPMIQMGETIGVNSAPWLRFGDGRQRGDVLDVTVKKINGHHDLACTQDYHRLEVPEHLAPKGGEVRDVLQRSVLGAHEAHAGHSGDHAAAVNLWPDDHKRPGHNWAMVIDLTVCTGCSGCVVSCQAENNVPVVGRDEVGRHREMHWLRIDRYHGGEDDSLRVSHQPMMCQHCDNAPCEVVCPVLATVHSSEGLNQQVYNRCVGTRYCANTCPYKVRRFNWFDYPRDDEHANHALNPDVTVRSRGVMEKCSMCAQRIQEAKSAAHREGRLIADGEIQTACQQSCPTKAIVFGDLSDPESEVSVAMGGPRRYRALEELNVRPSVGYLTEVRNPGQAEAKHDDK